MKKRFVKHIHRTDFNEEFYEPTIEVAINKYAEENDLIIIQFQIHSCTDASVLYEENFERAYIEKFIEYLGGDPIAHNTVERCSKCGSKIFSKVRCSHCNAKLFEKPST
ncbi:MAG: hypothetical protein J6R47_04255 [Acholeplasmatales bacterium]|nr:hypothetical protein [Acholeplasmatales bacterium]